MQHRNALRQLNQQPPDELNGASAASGVFISRTECPENGRVRLAVKDVIDVAGLPTTAGCQAVAMSAVPADSDAACLSGARAADVCIVGKTTLDELAYSARGSNPSFGTPVNPLNSQLIPGGSSSGSAVAVANDLADIAYGTDTCGSIRIPAACTGVLGLKTTHGRISLKGVWPLAPDMDTVGPMGRDAGAILAGMRLLEPGFDSSTSTPQRVARISTNADPTIEAAVNEALRRWGIEVITLELPRLRDSHAAAMKLLSAQAARSNSHLMQYRTHLGRDTAWKLDNGHKIDDQNVAAAFEVRDAWRDDLASLFREFSILALPTLGSYPPEIHRESKFPLSALTSPFSLSGHPSLAVPIPSSHPALPASLQLVGPPMSEELLVTAAQQLSERRLLWKPSQKNTGWR